MQSATDAYGGSFWSGLRPDPRLLVSEWADQNRWLLARGAAEPGRWRTSRTPYLREIMDSLSPSSPVEQVVLMSGAQVGKTEAGNNWIGYVIAHSPGPMLVVFPSLLLAQRYSRQKLTSLIDGCPSLRERVREPRSRDSGNTMLAKEFPGGILLLAGANSAANLRGMSVRYEMLDDVDGFPGDAEGEGDPAELAKARMRTFSNRKLYENSTPTFTGRSRIERDFLETDQRYYHVPCPHCGHGQVLRWPNLRWDKGRPDTAAYACESCGALIGEHHKTAMLAAGTWVPSRPEADPRKRGYHLSSLYSPLGLYSWADAAQAWEEAQGQPDRLRTFVNTVLGETWRERGEAPEWERLHDRREDYPIGTVPERGLVLTAGADVQHDRIEVEVVAWGRGMESWSVEYLVLPGDTAGEGPWMDLDLLLARSWRHARGTSLSLRTLAVDAGDRQSIVTNWTRRRPRSRVMAVKGRGNYPVMVGQPAEVDVTLRGRRLQRGARLWPVGVGLIKSELYGWLRMKRPEDPAAGLPAGWCHFPLYPEEYFKQLTAEELVTHVVRGYRKTEWEKMPNRRNEVLDCRTYARAAAAVLGLDRWPEEQWSRVEAALGVAPPPARPQTAAPAAGPPEPPTRAARPRRPRGEGGYFGRWRRD